MAGLRYPGAGYAVAVPVPACQNCCRTSASCAFSVSLSPPNDLLMRFDDRTPPRSSRWVRTTFGALGAAFVLVFVVVHGVRAQQPAITPATAGTRPVTGTAPTPAARGARAIALARLDAAIHYFDPVAAAVSTPWDSLFAQHAPAVLDAPSPAAYRDALTTLLAARGDALSALTSPTAATWQLSLQDRKSVV